MRPGVASVRSRMMQEHDHATDGSSSPLAAAVLEGEIEATAAAAVVMVVVVVAEEEEEEESVAAAAFKASEAAVVCVAIVALEFDAGQRLGTPEVSSTVHAQDRLLLRAERSRTNLSLRGRFAALAIISLNALGLESRVFSAALSATPSVAVPLPPPPPLPSGRGVRQSSHLERVCAFTSVQAMHAHPAPPATRLFFLAGPPPSREKKPSRPFVLLLILSQTKIKMKIKIRYTVLYVCRAYILVLYIEARREHQVKIKIRGDAKMRMVATSFRTEGGRFRAIAMR